MTIPAVSNEIGRRDSSIVELAFDSKSNLTAVKTSQNSNLAELTRREVSILKRLKHPLILEFREHISDPPEHDSAIVIEFAGNGSLASHLPSI
jgi:serine/threonine protein kinase